MRPSLGINPTRHGAELARDIPRTEHTQPPLRDGLAPRRTYPCDRPCVVRRSARAPPRHRLRRRDARPGTAAAPLLHLRCVKGPDLDAGRRRADSPRWAVVGRGTSECVATTCLTAACRCSTATPSSPTGPRGSRRCHGRAAPEVRLVRLPRWRTGPRGDVPHRCGPRWPHILATPGRLDDPDNPLRLGFGVEAGAVDAARFAGLAAP